MGIELAKAFVSVRGDASHLASDIRNSAAGAETAVAGLAGRLNGMFGAIGIGFGVYQLFGELRNAAAAAEGDAVSVRNLDIAMKTMGESIGFSTDQLNGWVDEIWKASTLEDDALRAAAESLLRYDVIQGDVFKRVMQVAADYSRVFGGVQGAAMMIGRALQYPESASRMLRLSGIRLTEQQQDQIKSFMILGERAKAAGIILEAFESKRRGAAKMELESPEGRLAAQRRALGEMKEDLGRLTLPLETSFIKMQMVFTRFLTTLVDMKLSFGGLAEEITRAALALGAFALALKGVTALTTGVVALGNALKGVVIAGAGLKGIAGILAGIGVLLATEPLPEETDEEKRWLAYKKWYEEKFKATPFRSMMPPGWTPTPVISNSPTAKAAAEAATPEGISPTQKQIDEMGDRLTYLRRGLSETDILIEKFARQEGVSPEQIKQFTKLARSVEEVTNAFRAGEIKAAEFKAITQVFVNIDEQVARLKGGLSESALELRRFAQMPGVQPADIVKMSEKLGQRDLWSGIAKAKEEAKALAKELLTPAEQYEEELKRIADLVARGGLTPEFEDRAKERARKAFLDSQQKDKGEGEWTETRMGFLDFGRKIQDMMLRRNEQELQRQMVNEQKIANERLAGIERGVNRNNGDGVGLWGQN